MWIDMAESYNDILKVSIGKVLASAVIDNYFPIVGQTIRIDATTKWGRPPSGRHVTAAGRR